ncbi:MAG: glycosyltransferase family 9 protein [Chthoniobacterales bacterium]
MKQGHPQAMLIVCTHHRRGSIARHNPFADEIISLSKSPISQARLLFRFWKKKPDLIVALRVNEEAVPLGYLLNRSVFVGAIERCQPFQFLLSHPVITKDESHIVEETLKVALVAGGANVDRGMVYQVHHDEQIALCKKHPDLINKPYVVFQTGGGKTMAWRDWPPASYIEAIKWMKLHYPHHVILTGGHDNEAAGRAIAEACPWVTNLVEKTTLEETAVLLHGASMLVSSDTGVMHLGFAIGCPTLAILHYRSPEKIYGPLDYSPGHEIIELPLPVSQTFASGNNGFSQYPQPQDLFSKNLDIKQTPPAFKDHLENKLIQKFITSNCEGQASLLRSHDNEMKNIPQSKVHAAIARILARTRVECGKNFS